MKSDFIFDRIFVRLADNEDSHKILEAFYFGADRTIHMGLTCPLVSHRHKMAKMLSRDDSDFIFDRLFIKLAEIEGRHKISDKFDFSPLSTIGMRISYP